MKLKCPHHANDADQHFFMYSVLYIHNTCSSLLKFIHSVAVQQALHIHDMMEKRTTRNVCFVNRNGYTAQAQGEKVCSYRSMIVAWCTKLKRKQKLMKCNASNVRLWNIDIFSSLRFFKPAIQFLQNIWLAVLWPYMFFCLIRESIFWMYLTSKGMA